ncbi:SGNH/GDSL hydrolase family protein [Coralloluteibacterium stylophorae]|uniref:SGNH/GDSL hydrolase family protein n=1 Tax=Coralloluteibacterium stylophorae TaxID=1776034 RepID=A0AAP2G1G6_9GAMM|nr:SGNH/GDSL hydrolase family protein [Coralloluteibacterium stylophorae]MBS7458250.1 SGNH/GDSL hydrolase family protein [Coralloluteibacterium stylophorae]
MAATGSAAGADASPPVRYLALGDSYTIGEAVPEAGRWPVQLARMLRAEGVPLARPDTVATTGWTTDELDAGIDRALAGGGIAPPYGFVSLLIGVNNQYRGRGLDEYRAQFADLLERAVGFAGGRADRVLVLSIPDWGTTPFARGSGRDPARIADELDAFNAAARDIATAHGVAFVDITPLGRARADDPGSVAADGLHPSADLYRAWAQAALPTARRLLSTRD